MKRITFLVMVWLLLFISVPMGFAETPIAECNNCGPHVLGCYDLQVDVPKPQKPEEFNNWKKLFECSEGYIDWLYNTQSSSLYHLVYKRMAASGENPYDNPWPFTGTPGTNNTYDYIFRGNIQGVEGDYQASLFFCTAKSNRVVAQSSTHFERASEAKEIGTLLMPIMCGSGRSFPQVVGEFEVKRREESIKVARKPQLEILDYQSTMSVNTSQQLQFRLIDCDGFPLKDRRAQVHTNIGTLQTSEVTFNEQGVASVNYTAPHTKGNAEIVIDFDFEYPSERTGREYQVAYIAITDPQSASCALWHVDLTIIRSRKIGAHMDGAPISTSDEQTFDQLNPLQLAFDINPKHEVIPTSLTTNYTWKYEQKILWDGALTYHCWGTDTGKELNRWRITAKRYLKPVPGEAKLNVYDLDDTERELGQFMENANLAQQPENTFKMEWDLVLPGRIKRVDYLGNNGVEEDFEMLPSFSDKLVFDYQYQNPVHQENDKNMPVVTEQFSPQVKTEEKYTVSYKISLNPLKFEITPGGWMGESSFLNYAMTTLVKDEDCSSQFKTVLFWRDWNASINPVVIGAPRTTAYQGSGIWQSDTVPAGNVPLDVETFLPARTLPTEKWATRYLREYLVAIDEFPEFGFYYFIVAMTNEPYRCRIQGWEARRISSSDWQMIKQLNHPYLDEASGGSKIDLKLSEKTIKKLLK